MLNLNQGRWISLFVWGVMMCLMIACADVPLSENPLEGDWNETQSALIDSKCIVDGMGGPTSCKPEALWVQYAEDACADQDMILTKYRVGKKCGKDTFRYIKYQCCPKEPLGDVCCKTGQGYQTIPASKCPDSQLVNDEYCEDDPTGEPCIPANLGSADQCQSEMDWIIAAQAHCKQQYAMVMTQHSVGGMCGDGLYHAIKFLCCPVEVPEEICCKVSFGTGTGNALYTTPDDCKKQGGIPTTNDYCDQTVCCNTSSGAQFMTMTDCPFLNVLADSDCEPDPEPTMCENFEAIDMANLPATLSNGTTLLSYSGWGTYGSSMPSSNSCSTIPAGAQRGAVGVNNPATLVFDTPVSEFYILQLHVQPGDDLTIPQASSITQMGCAPGGFGPSAYHHVVLSTPSTVVNIQDVDPGGGSGYSFLLANCTDEPVVVEEICCKISFGTGIGNALYTTLDDCKKQGGIPTTNDYCDQTVCCNTSSGAQFMTMTDCPFLNVLADSDCEADPEPSTCETFKAIDMGNLPVSLSNGASLLSYSGWGIWPTTLISSNSCSTIPAGSQRAAVGVNNDATLTFDQPISEFYLLTLYVQPGDDLTIAQPATITQMGCVPGGQAGNGYYHIVLDTPSAVVTIQDVDPGGGSGYSFMIADCDDEVVVEDVCCELATVQIVPADQCPPNNVLPMSLCEDPEPPTCENFEAINMAGLPSGNLSTGGILTGYTGWGTWASGLPSSNSCSTIPAGAERGFVGVNNDATLTFDTPVSEFYLLQLHVQPGDELTITQPATITQMGCAPGGFGGSAYHHIALATPTTTVTIEDINPGGGSGYSIMVANCVDNVVVEDVCCKLDNGFQIVPANLCPAGQQVSMSYCEDPVEDVCCKLSPSPQIVPSNQCPPLQVLPMSYCKEPVEDVCCKLDNGFQIVPANQCPTGQQVSMSYCKEPVEDVCCKLDSGVQIVPANQCPPGHQVSMNLCEDEDVCCELAGGPQTVPASQCPPGHILPDALCEEPATTCCRLDTGFAWVPTGQCPPQLVSPDFYCEEVCCETTDGYQTLPSYQCPASLVVSDSYCTEKPCDDAVYGQCEGFDYSNDQYCDAGGLDCGPQGILGDLDCDGEYEVCLACPAGTEPKDTNGDGCEDVCDCIDDTTTPTGPVELEPAKK